jgi:hypothetical protein
MKNLLLTILGVALLLTCKLGIAQSSLHYSSLALSIAGTAYYGDLDDNDNNLFRNTGVGLNYERHVTNRVGFRTEYWFAKLSGSDRGETFNQKRNLDFFTNIHELNALLIWYGEKKTNSLQARQQVIPYLGLGIAGFYFNPKTKLNDIVYELHQLGTEGQYIKDGNYPAIYNRYQLALPILIGINVKLEEQISVGIEMSYRKTFTDYLDDVSGKYPDKQKLAEVSGQTAVLLSDRTKNASKEAFSSRGDSTDKDWYSYANIKFVWLIRNKSNHQRHLVPEPVL